MAFLEDLEAAARSPWRASPPVADRLQPELFDLFVLHICRKAFKAESAIQILGEQLHGYGPRRKEAANRGALWQRHRGHGVPELRRPYWRDGSSAKSS